MLTSIPDELLFYITNNSEKYKLKSIYIRNNCRNYNRNIYIIAANRIALYYKLFRNIKNLQQTIKAFFIRIFSNCYFPQPYECLYYAPHKPDGTCRFCNSQKHTHTHTELIDRFYI